MADDRAMSTSILSVAKLLVKSIEGAILAALTAHFGAPWILAACIAISESAFHIEVLSCPLQAHLNGSELLFISSMLCLQEVRAYIRLVLFESLIKLLISLMHALRRILDTRWSSCFQRAML